LSFPPGRICVIGDDVTTGAPVPDREIDCVADLPGWVREAARGFAE
jgi:hypothetical protein